MSNCIIIGTLPIAQDSVSHAARCFLPPAGVVTVFRLTVSAAAVVRPDFLLLVDFGIINDRLSRDCDARYFQILSRVY